MHSSPTSRRVLWAVPLLEAAFGARPLRRVILKNLQDPLAEAILRGGYAPGDAIVVDVKDAAFTFEKKT